MRNLLPGFAGVMFSDFIQTDNIIKLVFENIAQQYISVEIKTKANETKKWVCPIKVLNKNHIKNSERDRVQKCEILAEIKVTSKPDFQNLSKTTGKMNPYVISCACV